MIHFMNDDRGQSRYPFLASSTGGSDPDPDQFIPQVHIFADSRPRSDKSSDHGRHDGTAGDDAGYGNGWPPPACGDGGPEHA